MIRLIVEDNEYTHLVENSSFGLVALFVNLGMTVLMINQESDANFACVHSIIIMVVPTLMSITLSRHSEIGQTWIDSRLRSLLLS